MQAQCQGWFALVVRAETYPRLSRMVMDYLSIPGNLSFFILLELFISFAAMSVDVK